MHPSHQEPPCNVFSPERVVDEMRYLWACLTEELGPLEEGHARLRPHPACVAVHAGPLDALSKLRHRAAAGFMLARAMAVECAGARGLDVGEYLAEKGAALAQMAEREKSRGVG